MTTRTLITVAPTGAETAKADAPALPVTLDELVSTAVACQDAGAAVIHVHVRDDAHSSTLDVARVRAAVDAIRSASELIVQVSSGGAVHDTEADRLRVLDASPDAASLTCGTVNFGDDVFTNRWPFVVELYTQMQARGIVPEFECFDTGHVSVVQRLLDTYGPPAGGHVHVDFVLGTGGGLPGTPAALAFAVSLLPDGATWSATGVGRTHLPVLEAALATGGHVRVGMEDVLTFAPGEPVQSNAQLVERAASMATSAGRPPMSCADARTLLGVRATAAVS